jgi:hypothetical protein
VLASEPVEAEKPALPNRKSKIPPEFLLPDHLEKVFCNLNGKFLKKLLILKKFGLMVNMMINMVLMF